MSLRLVFAGTPEVAVPALEALQASSHEVVAVVTRPDARSGRGRGLVQSPVRQWAQERDIEVLTPRKPGEEDFLERLRALEPDVCPVVAYGALIPPAALDVPQHGWVNLHFSLLPAWRGAAPVQHAVMAGDELTGASTFLIEQGARDQPAVGDHGAAVRCELAQPLGQGRVGGLGRLERLEAGLGGPLGDRRPDLVPTPAGPGVRAGEDGDDLVLGGEQRVQRRDGDLRCAGEDEAHGG